MKKETKAPSTVVNPVPLPARKLFGVLGVRGAGKTTVANYAVEKFKLTKASFADPLKKIVTEMLNIPSEWTMGQLKETVIVGRDYSYRDAMIIVGDMLRYFEPNYFVDRLKARLTSNPTTSFIIDDVRRKNEVDMLVSLGATTIRVNRYVKDLPYKTEINHSSETELLNYEADWVINDFDNKTVRDLQLSSGRIIQKVLNA